jgi:hypothetical protein
MIVGGGPPFGAEESVFLLPVQSEGARNGHRLVGQLGANLTGVEVNNRWIVRRVGE